MGIFHTLFEHKKLIYKKRDKQTYIAIKSLLKENHIKGISCGHYLQEEVIPGVGASHLDPRNMGPNGRIDRDIYYIKVPVSSYDNACNIIRSHGIKAEVLSDQELMQSPATKARAKISEINQQF